MFERLTVYERCIAIQLSKEVNPPYSALYSSQQLLRIEDPSSVDAGPSKEANSSGTPTPTNLLQDQNGHVYYSQEGFGLFQSFIDTNASCIWDRDLSKAVKGAHFVGALAGGYILVGGPPRVLAAIAHAHSRALLKAPSGWSIVVLGEIQECEMSVIQRGQFTPLGDALCWVIHKMTSAGISADQKRIRKDLLAHFPLMTPPEPSLIHAALSDLIRQRKVFHAGRGYGIVVDRTYCPPAIPSSSSIEAVTARTTKIQEMGTSTHVAIQTDLADLLSGLWPSSSLLSAKPPPIRGRGLERAGSIRSCSLANSNPFLVRRFNDQSDAIALKGGIGIYVGVDQSDISIKGGDKASVLSKILRVSNPRRRLASFSVQFPPPEWMGRAPTVKHLHCVATQTRSSRHPGGPEACWFWNVQWPPRSSTLPRRPQLSTSPVHFNAMNFRPQSASPSHVKLQYDFHNGFNKISGFQTLSSSSVCLTSRNPSPSTHSENNYYSSSSKGSPLKFSSPRKPPLTSSPRHVCSKDTKRKLLFTTDKETVDAMTGTRHQSHSPARGKIKGKLIDLHNRSSSEGSSIAGGEWTSKQSKGRTRDNDQRNVQPALSSTDVHMNNSRKFVVSPQKPEGLKNVFQENLSTIVKGSMSEFASKNMGYKDVNKCEKKLYSQECQTTPQSVEVEAHAKGEDKESSQSRRRLKLSLPLSETLNEQSMIALHEKNNTSNQNQSNPTPEGAQPVRNYPSLSELNLSFSSLAAQKILQGVSINSIDTLVEVNMFAEKRKQSINEGVTNTDFGFI